MLEDLRQLVGRCLRGEQAAMRDLVSRFQSQVFGLCYRMLGHRQDAEDVSQETFVRVLKSLSHWDPTRDFEPWLLAIAGNRCRTALATRSRRPAGCSLEEEWLPGTVDGHAEKLLAEEVQLVLSRMRPEYCQAFVLFHEQELEYTQIAEAMNVPVGTVKTWVHRARKEMIRQLQQRGIVEEQRHVVRAV